MAPGLRWAYLPLLALVAPYIRDRYIGLSGMLANAPAKLEGFNSFKSYEIKFADQIRNCEDVILEESLGVALLSCDPGRDRWNTVMGTFQPPNPTKPDSNFGTIYLYDYINAPNDIKPFTFSPSWPGASDFHPLGLAFDSATSLLYAINHARSGSVIEIFIVSLSSHTLTHAHTFSHPLLHTPNAMHLLDDGRMYVTNDHYLRAAVNPILSKIETFAAIPGGNVAYVDTKTLDVKVLAHVPFANGVVKLNDSTVVVASSSKPGLYFYDVAPNGVDLKWKQTIRTPAGADNLSLDSKGKILIAGHPYALELMEVSKGRPECDEHGTEDQREKCGCWAPSWVGEWSEKGGLKTLMMDSGKGEKAICSSSTAVRDAAKGVGLLSMLYGRGLVVFRE